MWSGRNSGRRPPSPSRERSRLTSVHPGNVATGVAPLVPVGDDAALPVSPGEFWADTRHRDRSPRSVPDWTEQSLTTSRVEKFAELTVVEWIGADVHSDRNFDDKAVVGSVLVAFAGIGIVGAGQTANGGVAVTWIWTGIGLSVIYLLYRVVVTLEQLVDTT